MSRSLRIVLIVAMIFGALFIFYGALSDRVTFFGMMGLLVYPVGLGILVIASFALRFKAYSVLICAALAFTFCCLSKPVSGPIVDWQVRRALEEGIQIAEEISSEYKKEGSYPSDLSAVDGGDQTFFIGPYLCKFYYENQDSTFELSLPCRGGARQVWNNRDREFRWVE